MRKPYLGAGLALAFLPSLSEAAFNKIVDPTKTNVGKISNEVETVDPNRRFALRNLFEFHCQPEIIDAFNEIWRRSNFGRDEDREVGMNIMRNQDGSIELDIQNNVAEVTVTRERVKGSSFRRSAKVTTVSLRIGIGPSTIGVAHTHPNSYPAGPGPNDFVSIPTYRPDGKGGLHTDRENKTPIPNYILSNKGLYLIQPPKTKQRLRRKTEWLKPCPGTPEILMAEEERRKKKTIFAETKTPKKPA